METNNTVDGRKSNREKEKLEAIVEKLALSQNAMKKHEFWDTQPIVKMNEKVNEIGPIETKTISTIKNTPLSHSLPEETLCWYEMDVNNDVEIKELFDLLENNYVEDDDATIRLAYSITFLKWALTPPSWKKEWHLTIIDRQTKKFMAFISAIPAKMRVFNEIIQMVEINFLCIHKNLRSSRLAPVLISEITRRVNLHNIWQAINTAGILLPKPFCITKYMHRHLNSSKLIEIKFARIPDNLIKSKNPVKLLEEKYKLPSTYQIDNFRPMVKKDIPQVDILLKNYLKKFKVAPELSRGEISHWFRPITDVIQSFVVESKDSEHKITDFISYYIIPSTIIGHKKHKILKTAYLYYYVAEKYTLTELIKDCLIHAKNNGCDVFNCLDIMENKTFLEELLFGMGTGNLYYYIYNYKLPMMKSDDLGLVML